MKRFLVITVAALGALLLATAQSALAQDVNCADAPYFGMINGPLTINGNLVVPDNTNCLVGNHQLAGPNVTVTGNVRVGNNATYTLEGNSIVGGNIIATNCKSVVLNPAHAYSASVGRNVEILNCTGTTAFLANGVTGNPIGGNFLCLNNTGACILNLTTVGGNAEFLNNDSSSPSQINGSVIDGDLLCQNNAPAPTGTGNTVGNHDQPSEGQCRGF